MTRLAFIALLPVLFGLVGVTPAQPQQQQGVRRVWVHDELIISIPVRPRPIQGLAWVEKKGPKCIEAKRIAGAMLSSPSSIDFIMRDRSMVRAKMDNKCPGLDFYKGFYLQPDDGRVCAKRETIRNRVGASCRIEKFRSLVPQSKQVKR